MLVAPSILNVDESSLPYYLNVFKENAIDFLHLDIMDGIFVNNKTYDDKKVAYFKQLSLIPLDVHLMIVNPEKYVDNYLEHHPFYLTFHVEATDNPSLLIDHIQSHDVKAGISIKPKTPVKDILDYLSKIDLILVMSVEPGFGGQPFMESVLTKIQELNCLRKENNYHYLIEVDGGINLESATYVKEVGADIVVSGSYLIRSPHIEKTIKELKEL